MFKCGATKVVLEFAVSSSRVTWCYQAAHAFVIEQIGFCMPVRFNSPANTTNGVLAHKSADSC